MADTGTECIADIHTYLLRTGRFIMKGALPLMGSSMFWTLYLLSLVFAIRVLWRQGFTRARISLTVFIWTMFILDTMIFIMILYEFFFQTREILFNGMFEGPAYTTVRTSMIRAEPISSILSLVMLIPGDCIVVWRAFVLWTGPRITKLVPVGLLIGCIVNIPFLVTCNVKHRQEVFGDPGAIPLLTNPCLATQTSAWVLSFSANIAATFMIVYMAWWYHTSQKHLDDVQSTSSGRASKVGQVLLLLVESGFVYLVVVVCAAVSAMYPEPVYGTRLVVVDFLGAIMSHCVGMVPTLTILLINRYGSFDGPSSVDISQPIRFANPRISESPYISAIEHPTMVFGKETVEV
ncbi:hypothetical protein C8J56DRAFT_948873 [Mycena floridula]|nr:hypothetical protein C8J56DRAFT_948873 [Mycena floridula]